MGAGASVESSRRQRPRMVMGAALVAVALVSGSVSAVAVTALDDDSPASRAESLDSPNTTSASNEPVSNEPLAQAAAAVLPSVVSVNVGSGQLAGQGSGVVIGRDGTILTNNHVVSAAGDDAELSVTFSDGTTAPAEVVGTDPATDLAVIRAEGVDDATPAQLGSSADLSVGDTVLAIGSPLGLEGSVSSGIVSAMNRAIDLGQSSQPLPDERQQTESSTPTAVIDAIQTDAAINPGNSGGPLIDTDGNVVGINTAIASLAGGTLSSTSGSIGLGFAIPIDEARDIAEELIEDGEASHAYLGVQIAEATEADDGSQGVAVTGVEEGSPAAEAELQRGDVVTAIDGEPVRDPAELAANIRSHDPGDEVTLEVRRNGETIEVSATLDELPTGS